MSVILLGLAVVCVIGGSATVTYFISISRERLWLRSQKSEDLYRRAERTYVDASLYSAPATT